MALSDTTVRQARITGNDYTLGDTDGLALNVTAAAGKSGVSILLGGRAEAYVSGSLSANAVGR